MRAAISPLQAFGHASDFAGWVWSHAWGVQLLAAVGPALVFVGLFGAIDAGLAADLIYVGSALGLVAAAPLAGALLRLRLGGVETLGPSGLQFGMTELRLLGAALSWMAASLLAWLPVVAAVAAVFILFRDAGMVDLRGVGVAPASFLVAGAVVAGAAAAYGYGCIRLLMALPASVARSRLAIAEGWRVGAGAEVAVAGGLLLSLVPVVLLCGAVMVLDGQTGPLGWAWQDAAVAGAVFGGMLSFVQAPLTLGLLGSIFILREMHPPMRSAHARRLEGEFSSLRA